MQMTRYSDYSLRTLIYLGLHRDRRCTIREIADAYGISENHLMKLVHQLGREGFVRTTRGKKGAVFRAMEGNFHLVECFKEDGNTCPIAGPCVLSRVLDEALQAFLEVLDRHTLEDLLAPSHALGRIFAARQEAAIRLQ